MIRPWFSILKTSAYARVRSAPQIQRNDVIGRKPIGPWRSDQPDWKILVQQESHDAGGNSGCPADGWRQMSCHVCGVRQRGAHLLCCQHVLGGDGFNRLAGGKKTDDRGDVDAGTRDAGLPEADVGIHRDSGKDFHRSPDGSFALELDIVN